MPASQICRLTRKGQQMFPSRPRPIATNSVDKRSAGARKHGFLVFYQTVDTTQIQLPAGPLTPPFLLRVPHTPIAKAHLSSELSNTSLFWLAIQCAACERRARTFTVSAAVAAVIVSPANQNDSCVPDCAPGGWRKADGIPALTCCATQFIYPQVF